MNRTFNKFDQDINPNFEPDAHVELTLLSVSDGGRDMTVTSAYRPHFRVADDYLTSTAHFFVDVETLSSGETCDSLVAFISPEAYPKSLRVGQVLDVCEASRVVGKAKIVEVYNDILKNC
jgi:elongation factor Tu